MGSNFKVDGDIGELSPGSTPRRFEPEGGTNKHNERIHRESKLVDSHSNLPFTFSKPRKTGSRTYFKCKKCDHVIYASVNVVGMICPECKKYTNVEEIKDE